MLEAIDPKGVDGAGQRRLTSGVHLDRYHQRLGGREPSWDVDLYLNIQIGMESASDDGSLSPTAHAADSKE